MDDRVSDFLHFMSVERSASSNTIDAYRNDLLQFRVFLSTKNLNGANTDWTRISKDVILEFLSDMRNRRYAEATVARKVAAVKSFFQYLQAEGAIKANPTETLESPRVGKTLPRRCPSGRSMTCSNNPRARRRPKRSAIGRCSSCCTRPDFA
jgi:integrase/recombinase XerD